jgi:nicotinamide mononucleotide transporter
VIDWQRVLHELSPMEIAAAIATLINVWLLVRNNIWTWAWGVASVILYGIVFYRSRLWSSTGLQLLYYLPMQAYGWWVWMKNGPTHHDDLPVSRLSTQARLAWTAATLPMAWLLGWLMSFTGAQQSMMDALVTAISVSGQYLQTHKKIEHWFCWVVVNAVYGFWLLPRQHLWVSAVLYLILLGMSVHGWRAWAQTERAQTMRDVNAIQDGLATGAS